MAKLNAKRLQRYCLTIRENIEDVEYLPLLKVANRTFC